MSLPLLHLEGTPHQQGISHGRQLRDHIAHNIQVYFERFQSEAGLPRAEVLERAVRYGKAIARQNADYFAAIQGIAAGSGLDLDELLALNVRYEIIYSQLSMNALADGCTSFVVTPEASASGHLLMGQNWDWIPQVHGAVLHTVEPDGLETVSFTEAGIVGGKIGLNSAGLGLAVNGLHSTDDDWSRLSKPFHVRCYEILRARDLETAVQVVTNSERACSTNFLMAQPPDRVANVEAAPKKASILSPQNGRLVHTNHFLDPRALDVVEPPREPSSSTCHRLERLHALLGSRHPLAVEDIQDYLRDHQGYPHSICCHEDTDLPPGNRYLTVTSAVIDLDRRELNISDGPPCHNEYQRVRL
ncbi:MAG: C45 family autoproteolytic acyltransferase/hydolase [Anaerolineae bacterium]